MNALNRNEPSDYSPRIEISPDKALADQVVSIRLIGFPPDQWVTIRGSLQDDLKRVWTSQATFETDEDGCVDLSSARPLSGTYDEADPMGLFWSMELDQNAPERSAFAKSGVDPLAVSFTAQVGGEIVATCGHERSFLRPGVREQPVQEAGLAGTFFFPSDQEPHLGILVFGGSGGGLMWAYQMAALLASHGYAALALAYFAYEQLPPALVEIPLEYFETALGWMQTRDAVFRDRLAVMGMSRGGELALLLGATFKQIRAVVAYVPSHVIFGDFQAEEKPSWSHCGKPLPFIQRRIHPDLVDESLQREPIPFLPWFLANYDFDDPVAVGDAVIPVERTNGPILLISGQDDQMWPSALMAQKVIERLDQHDFPFSASHLSYPGAGHWLSFPYLPVTVNHIRHPIAKFLCALGGSPRDHCRAQADSWMKTCRFLEENLRVR